MSPIFPNPYDGVRIIEDITLTDMVEDWSKVRSPSRARRRLRQGHRQNIRFLQAPKKHVFAIDGGRTLIMHPEMARQLRAMTKVLPTAAKEPEQP